jgi:hypothetical protein
MRCVNCTQDIDPKNTNRPWSVTNKAVAKTEADYTYAHDDCREKAVAAARTANEQQRKRAEGYAPKKP